MARIPPRALSSGSGLAVEKRDAIPEQISSVRLQEQSALAYRKFRFGARSPGGLALPLRAGCYDQPPAV